jgi:hypothetical protein
MSVPGVETLPLMLSWLLPLLLLLLLPGVQA